MAEPNIPPEVEQNQATHVTQEELQTCLSQLEQHFNRGIVKVLATKNLNDYLSELQQNATAGLSWNEVYDRLTANDSALIKKACQLQGGGELIGVDYGGRLLIISGTDNKGHREPEYFGFLPDQLDHVPQLEQRTERLDNGTQQVVFRFSPPDVYKLDNLYRIKTGMTPVRAHATMPNRDEVLQLVATTGMYARYSEMKKATEALGFEVPCHFSGGEKTGLIAATEAVTQRPFISSAAGDVSTIANGSLVRPGQIRYIRDQNEIRFYNVLPSTRSSTLGCVLVLRG